MRITLLLTPYLLLAGSFLSAAVVHTPIAVTGGAAPGGGVYQAFNLNTSHNSSGQVAFYADATGGPNGGGLFLGDGAVTQAIARVGNPAPVEGNYAVLGTGKLNEQGDLLFGADLTGGPASNGQFIYREGSLSTVLLMGSTSPDGGTYGSISGLTINDLGTIAYNANLSNPIKHVLYRHENGITTSIALTPQQAPGGGDYANFFQVDVDNSRGILFAATLRVPEVITAIFRNDTSGTSVLARQGDTTPAGGRFGYLGGFYHNENREIAFYTDIIGGSSSGGIFRTGNSPPTLIAALGATTPIGGTYSGLIPFALNDLGQVAFTANAVGVANNYALFLGDGASTEIIARLGDTAPGTSAKFSQKFNNVQMSNGFIAFQGNLRLFMDGVTEANDAGLWIGTSADDLTLLVREGDKIRINGIDRTVTAISSVFTLQDNTITWLANLSSGRAIMRTTFIAVPEPATFSLFLIGAITFGIRFCRSQRGLQSEILIGENKRERSLGTLMSGS